MDAPNPSRPSPTPHLAAFGSDPDRWQALLDELTVLNTKLEYLKLMLKLGVRRV